MDQLKVLLSGEEYKALFDLAQRETRSLPGQARHIIRKELADAGLLPSSNTCPNPMSEQRAGALK